MGPGIWGRNDGCSGSPTAVGGLMLLDINTDGRGSLLLASGKRGNERWPEFYHVAKHKVNRWKQSHEVSAVGYQQRRRRVLASCFWKEGKRKMTRIYHATKHKVDRSKKTKGPEEH